MDIKIERLIDVIKDHKLLYDVTEPEYFDRNKKRLNWESVYKQLHGNWDECHDLEKTLYGKEVQKKWHSLRDCFRRELASQRNPSKGKKKKKTVYKYYDHLSFLAPYTSCVETSNEGILEGLEYPEEEYIEDPLEEEVEKPTRKRKKSQYEEIVLDTSQLATGSRRLDDDEAFLMSLVPGMKQYSLDEKYRLRIQIMQTILKFKGQVNRVLKIGGDDDDS